MKNLGVDWIEDKSSYKYRAGIPFTQHGIKRLYQRGLNGMERDINKIAKAKKVSRVFTVIETGAPAEEVTIGRVRVVVLRKGLYPGAIHSVVVTGNPSIAQMRCLVQHAAKMVS